MLVTSGEEGAYFVQPTTETQGKLGGPGPLSEMVKILQPAAVCQTFDTLPWIFLWARVLLGGIIGATANTNKNK